MLIPLFDTNPHGRLPFVTVAIIVVNAAAMFWLAHLPPGQVEETIARRGFIPARMAQLTKPNVVVEVALPRPPRLVHPLVPIAFFQQPKRIQLRADRGEILLSLVTMMFLHGNLMHIVSNMWFLWIFGNNIEDRLGHLVFLLFYLLGGLFAAIVHWATGPDSLVPVIGASGAVAAVLGGYALTFPTAKVRTLIFLGIFFTLVDLPALVVLGFWFLVQMASALGVFQAGMNQNIAFWAHVGGFVAGLVMMPLLSVGASPTDRDWRTEMKELFEWDDPRDKR